MKIFIVLRSSTLGDCVGFFEFANVSITGADLYEIREPAELVGVAPGVRETP